MRPHSLTWIGVCSPPLPASRLGSDFPMASSRRRSSGRAALFDTAGSAMKRTGGYQGRAEKRTVVLINIAILRSLFNPPLVRSCTGIILARVAPLALPANCCACSHHGCSLPVRQPSSQRRARRARSHLDSIPGLIRWPHHPPGHPLWGRTVHFSHNRHCWLSVGGLFPAGSSAPGR